MVVLPGHAICLFCAAHKAHIYGRSAMGFLWPRLTLLISLHSCNYPVFPFAFTLSRLSGNLFDFFRYLYESSRFIIRTKLRHELMQ
jgi:hypothetical protein